MKQNTFILSDKRGLILKLGTELFNRITQLPKDIRPDDKPRTGIQIVARIPKTRNLVMVSVKEPSEAARFFAVEKSARTDFNGHATSQESEDPAKMRFRGCVSYRMSDGTIVHCSVSGLLGPEDVTIALILLSRAVNASIDDVISNIKERGGKLPEEIFKEGHYLNKLLNEYK